MDKRAKMLAVLKELKKRYDCKPSHGRPFETLITTIISQRNTDVSTAKVSRALFKVASKPQGMARLPMRKLQSILRPAGPWKQKARHIHGTAAIIWKKYKGRVPRNRKALIELPGVGPKTADITLMYGFGIPSIAVDTHCNRIPRRLGLVAEKASIAEVKETLEALTPRRRWYLVNCGLVSLGQEICRAAKPRCERCPLLRLCPYGRKSIKTGYG